MNRKRLSLLTGVILLTVGLLGCSQKSPVKATNLKTSTVQKVKKVVPKKVAPKKVVKKIALKKVKPMVYYKKKYVAPIHKHVYKYVTPNRYTRKTNEVTQPKVLTHYIYKKIHNYKNQGIKVNNPKYNPKLPMYKQNIPDPWVEDQIQASLK